MWHVVTLKYYLYHICISHNINDCYILKDKIVEFIAVRIITLDNKEKQVAANNISIQFGTHKVVTIRCEHALVRLDLIL